MTERLNTSRLRRKDADQIIGGTGLALNEQTLEGFSDGALVADLAAPDLPLTFVNSAVERITGYSRAELLGRNCRFLQGADRQQPEVAAMSRAIAEGQDITVVLRNYRKDGTAFWNELRLQPLRDEQGRTTHWLGIMRDVTAYQELTVQLERVANNDDLTGLPTRRRFLAALGEAPRDGGLVVLCCDADQLRDVNGTYGRVAGDEVLREIGRRLGALPGMVAVSRLAAGQFALAVDVPPGPECAEAAVASIRAVLQQPFTLPGITVAMTVTIGWARAATFDGQAEPLLIQAEAALYAAKAAGRGEIRAFDAAIERQARRRLRLTAELRNALRHDEFVLYYQPKVDLCSGRIVGLEALLRWQHPVFGLQSPANFLGVAEESGLIVEIGAWALAEASRFAVALNQRGHSVYVAVNVSPVQFQRDDVPALVRRTLAKTGADPAWISLELTETVLADASARTVACFAELRRMGIGLAMDDFGTGFASLQCLRNLPFTEMKVDQNFVRNLDCDPVQAAIVAGALAVAHALGIGACCEGVETAAERDRLVAIGCPVAQGYFFSLPLAAEDLLWLMDNHSVLPASAANQARGGNPAPPMLSIVPSSGVAPRGVAASQRVR